MKKIALLAFIPVLFFGTAFIAASGLPQSTEVWLFTYAYSTGGKYEFNAGTNISNHEGYDNQPSFSENGSYMLWTSERENGQTEIYRYDLIGKSSKRITQTPESEYSPTYMYGNKFISSVVVEKDSTQRLWKYNKSTGKSAILLPKVYGVGYHCWYDATTVFLFQLTNPVTLVVCDTRSGTTKIVASNVGRCMGIYKSPRKKLLLYTQTDDSGKKWIKACDSNGQKEESFKAIPCVEGSEDFTVDKNGYLLMGAGSKLYKWDLANGQQWTEIADLSSYKIKSISRIAICPDGSHLAVVDNQE